MNKEQVTKLPCLVVCNGTSDRHVDTSKMRRDAVSSLMELQGKNVTVNVQKDYFCYTGEDEPEDQSHITEVLSGKVLSADDTSLRLDVESGERIGDKSSPLVNLGEIDIPYRRDDFALRQNRTIEAIQEIVYSDMVYRPIHL